MGGSASRPRSNLRTEGVPPTKTELAFLGTGSQHGQTGMGESVVLKWRPDAPRLLDKWLTAWQYFAERLRVYFASDVMGFFVAHW